MLAKGPKACMAALRSIAALTAATGDAHALLRTPARWPRSTHEEVREAFVLLAQNHFEAEVAVVQVKG